MTRKREQAKAIVLSALMVLSVIAIGSAGFAGSAAALDDGDVTVPTNVTLGAQAQEIGGTNGQELSITETTPGEFGTSSTTGEITLSGSVTFNRSASNPATRSVSNGSISNFQYSNNNQTLEFDASPTSGETEILFGNLDVDVPADTGDSFDVDVRIGTKSATETVDTDTPALFVSDTDNADPKNNTGTVTVGAASTSSAFSVQVAPEGSNDGQIGANTDVVLSANASNGITFDTSLDPTGLTYSNGADANLDTGNASFSSGGEELVVPVDSEFTSGDNVVINGLQVNASASAEMSSLLSVETEPTGSLSTVETLSGDSVDVTKPTVSVTENAAGVVGADGTGDISIDVSSATAGDIVSGTNVTITLNNSDVTFDTSQDLDPATGGTNNDLVTADDDIITDNSITFGIDSDSDGDETISLTNVAFNVSNQPADGAQVQVSAETLGSSSGPVITSSDTGTFLTLERPSIEFNDEDDGDFSLSVDNDGESGIKVGSDGGFSSLRVVSDGGVSQVAAQSYVNLTLESGTGVTFDTSADTNNVDGGTPASADVVDVLSSANDDVNNVTITDSTVSIGLQDSGGLASGEEIHIDELFLNATGSAQNTTLQVTTNTGDSMVTTDVDRQITVTSDTPSQIQADANTSDATNFENPASPTDSDAQPAVTETVQGAVEVQNGGAFGGADVNLDIVETPDGSSGASLDTTTVTTDSNGQATFNFTAGDIADDYVVNATIAGTSTGVNITYTAQSGSVAGVSVTPIENAVAGDSSSTGDAALYVNATDQFGNPVSESGTVDVTLSGGDNAIAYDAWDGDAGNTNQDTLDDGTFDIDSNDGSSVIIVEGTAVEDVTVSADLNGNTDSGTVTFFDTPAQIDLSINQTDTVPSSVVEASATISDSSGTTIEVPDVSATIREQGTSNTSLSSQSVSTNGSGVATTTFTADSVGSADIQGKLNIRDTDTETLTITQPTLSVSSDVSSVTPNTETDVVSTVTFANNGSAVEGATVNVTGAGVSVADQPTDADGNVSYSVNASSAGTITVEATLANTNAGQDTISVGSLGDLDASLTPDSVVANQSTDVTVTVTNASSGDAIEGATAAISGQDSNTTDANGEAVLSVNASSTADLTVDVSATGFNDTQTTLTVTSDSVPPNAVYNDPNSVPAQYDSDGDGKITRSEVTGGVNAYFDGTLQRTDVTELVNAYFDSQ